MELKHKFFMILLVFGLLLIVELIFLNNFITFDTKLLLGQTFNLEAVVKKVGLDLLHLDKFHAQLLLKKGLPIVRVEENSSWQESNDNIIMSRLSWGLFDLPPSFFNTSSQSREIIPSNADSQFDQSNQIKEKMRAEGHHQGEKVELDFWQTESTTNSSGARDNISQNLLQNKLEKLEEGNRRKTLGIYHTHTAENYENRGYNAHAQAGKKGDVVQVGRWIKERLETEYNISVIHSENVHDQTYDRSYIRSLKTAKRMVDDNKDLNMIFDIHRDAIRADNKEYFTTEINGQKVAKIMIVVTNSNYGLPHPKWQKNFSFAKKLAAKMNQKYPGLLRKVKLISNRRYNQHVHPKALLLEVGGANSKLSEAKRASYLLAEVLAELMAAES
mgnify:CR=1 FL=1